MPEDLKGVAVFLASAASDYVNGATIAVDGGFISVAHGHVSILSQVVLLGHEVGLDEAHREAAALSTKAYQGQADDQELHRLRILKAQIRAGEAAAKQAAS